MKELKQERPQITSLTNALQGRVVSSVCKLLFVLQFAAIAALSYQEYLGWDLSVWDFGFFAQAVHLIGQGQLNPFSSYEQIPFLRDHFALLMLPIGWLSRLLPGPVLLIATQAAGLSAGGFLIYQLFADKVREQSFPEWLKQTLLIVFAVGIVLYPWVYTGAAFDFHPDAFVAFFAALAVWAHYRKRPVLFWIGILFTLWSKDVSAIIVLSIGLVLVLHKDARVKGLLTFLSGVIWLVITQVAIKTAAAGGSHGEGQSHVVQMYGYLGSTPGQIIHTCLFHPLIPLLMLKAHLLTFVDALAPLGCLLLFSGWCSIPFVLSVVLMNGLSNDQPVISVQYHYLLMVSTLLFLGTGLGLIRVVRWLQRLGRKIVLLPVLLLAGSSLYWAAAWLIRLPSDKLLMPAASAQALTAAAQLIPPDAEVLTQNAFGKGFTPRQQAYLIGSAPSFPLAGTDCYALLNPLVGNHGQAPYDQVAELQEILHQPGASALFHKNGVWLIRFPVQSKELQFHDPQPDDFSYPGWVLPSNAGTPVLNGPDRSSWYMDSSMQTGYVVYGPYQRMLPGSYQAKVALSVQGNANLDVNIEVWNAETSQLLIRDELKQTAGVEELTLPFALREQDVKPFNPTPGKFGAKILAVPPSQAGNPIEVRVWTNGQGEVKVFSVSLAAVH